jgi:type II secretory pathway component PulL
MEVPKHTCNPTRRISALEVFIALLKRLWRRHRRLIDTNWVYRAVMVLLADAVVARLNLNRLLQVLHELPINLWAGPKPAH